MINGLINSIHEESKQTSPLDQSLWCCDQGDTRAYEQWLGNESPTSSKLATDAQTATKSLSVTGFYHLATDNPVWKQVSDMFVGGKGGAEEGAKEESNAKL